MDKKFNIKYFIVCLILLSCCSCATPVITHGIPNLDQVDKTIWRGGQPNDEGWKYLKSVGIHYDIKLNTECESSDDLATSNGIIVLSFPITFINQITYGPTYNKIICIINNINVIETNGVFIHCQHGQDRTGLVVGNYRVKTEGWKKEKAFDEMKKHGFHKSLIGLWCSWLRNVSDE